MRIKGYRILLPVASRVWKLDIEAQSVWWEVQLIPTCGKFWRWILLRVLLCWQYLWQFLPTWIRDRIMVGIFAGGERAGFWKVRVRHARDN